VAVKTYIHRDKIKCAIDLLEKGASQREIAKTCGLSMSQVSAIGREYGYYVDVRSTSRGLRRRRRGSTRLGGGLSTKKGRGSRRSLGI